MTGAAHVDGALLHKYKPGVPNARVLSRRVVRRFADLYLTSLLRDSIS